MTLLFVKELVVIAFCEVLAIYALSPDSKFAAGANEFNSSTTEPDPDPVISSPLTSKLK